LQYFECKVGSAAELIVVEGKHAANAVNQVRNKSNQSVLAMQGKVPNMAKNDLQRQIEKNDHVKQLTALLKSWAHPTAATAHHYSDVVILSDPDADGLHAAMLLVCLLAEAYPAMVRQESLMLCRSPLFLLKSDGEDEFAYSDRELDWRRQQNGKNFVQTQRFKGIASLPVELLRRECVDPQSRNVNVLSEADCAAIKNRLA